MLYTGQLQSRLKFLGPKGPKTAVGLLLSRLSEGAEDKQTIPLPNKASCFGPLSSCRNGAHLPKQLIAE